MDADVRKRLLWVQLLHQVGDAGQVCRRCGISRPTLRKWSKRYDAQGMSGVIALSRRPDRSPKRQVDVAIRLEEWQFDCNWRRSHGGLGGQTPADRIAEAGHDVPLREEVADAYDECLERFHYRDWRVDRTMAGLFRPVL